MFSKANVNASDGGGGGDVGYRENGTSGSVDGDDHDGRLGEIGKMA
jgi:hypothetical protein